MYSAPLLYAARMPNAALLLGAVAVTDMFVAPALAHFGVLRPMQAFVLWLLAGLLGLVAAVLAVIALANGHGPRAFIALGLGVAGLAVPALLILSAGRLPRLNDVATDVDDPPAFVSAKDIAENRGRDLAFPERFKKPVRESYGDLKPVVRDVPAAALFAKAREAAETMPGWEVTATDPAAGRIEAVAVSSLWQFRDDVVIRIREEGPGRARLDVRSKSRDGQSDFGANAARIRAFVSKL